MAVDLPIWALDTEDDSKGTIKLINFYDGSRHYTFKTRETALHFLLNDVGRAQIWACMAEYDLVNLFGDYAESLCEMTYLKSAFVKARLINAEGTRIIFNDTLRHWKLSVKAMGERLGYPKMAFDPDSVEYCQRDTEIVWRWVTSQAGYYAGLGTQLKSTIGSSAMTLFRGKFQLDNSQLFKVEIRDFLQAACRGGRVEIFKTGLQYGKIDCYDVNSMYPAVMRKFDYPDLNRFFWTKYPNYERHGVVEAVIKYPDNIDIPCLPHFKKKLIFPVGQFRGYWCYPEIRQALKDGAEIHVIRALEFPNSCRPFKKYVDYLYNKRAKSKDELERETLKLFLNNLFGKFGQKNGLELWRGPVVEEKATFSKDANMIWAAYTTCYARLELLALLRAAGGSLLYCDTDSLFTLNGPDLPTGAALGELKLVGSWATAHFVLPKVYMLEKYWGERKIRAKGIPMKAAHQFYDTYVAEYEAPIRFRESFRRSIKANVWVKKTRRLSHQYDKRVSLPNGETKPLYIRG